MESSPGLLQVLPLPLFHMHSGSVATLDKHSIPSPKPCAHIRVVHHTHTITHCIQHHAIHAPTPDIQHIDLRLVYNTTQICI